MESSLKKPSAEAPKPGSQEEALQMRQQMLWAQRGGLGYYAPTAQPTDPNKIVLVDGKAPSLPSCRSSAVRVRMVPSYIPFTGGPANTGEKLVPLEITPEPNLPWLGMISVRVDRAVDEHGQTLVQPALFLNQTVDPYGNMYGDVMFARGGMAYYSYPQQSFGNPNHAGVRLKMGDKVATSVKELQGIVTCQAQTPVEPMITVNDILKSAGSTVEGTDGGSIKVVEVKQEKSGTVKMKVVIQPPQDMFNAGDVNFGFGRQVIINRAVMQMKLGGRGFPVATAGAGNIELRDVKGAAFQLLNNNQPPQVFNGIPGGVQGAMEQELVFQPNAGQAAPAKLVYLGQRNVTIDVPFSLKDVPLP
jgi:hypothetical protein